MPTPPLAPVNDEPAIGAVADQAARVDHVAAAVAAARLRGEPVCDEEVLGRHPELAPGLRSALAFAGRLAAAAAVPTDPPTGPSLSVLTDEELESPIDVPEPLEGPPVIEGYDGLAEVGRGGQGVVYRGTEHASGLSVAVKLLPGGRFADPRARARFVRETRILNRLKCPGVVAAIGHGRTADGSLYLVMPFIDGPTLDAAAAAQGRDAAVARLFADLADAMESVHAAGVVHRDLKPANVRVGHDGRPYVLDFGLADSSVEADVSRSLTATGQVLGSLAYMSPEQVRGEWSAVDARSDVYAIGVMLCRAIAAGGAPPYPTDRPAHEVIDHVQRARPTVAGRASTDALAIVALRCLAKRPADRYPSAAALAADLRRVATGAGPRHRPWRWRPAVGRGAVVVVCGLAAGTALVGALAGRRPLPNRSDRPITRASPARKGNGFGPSPSSVVVLRHHDGLMYAWGSSAVVTTAEAAAVLGQSPPLPNEAREPALLTYGEALDYCKRSPIGPLHQRLPTGAELEQLRSPPPSTVLSTHVSSSRPEEWLAGAVATPGGSTARRAFHVVTTVEKSP